MTDKIKTITVDGVDHSIESLGPQVQQLVAIHQKWEAKLIDARLEVALVEAALRDLNKELTTKIQEVLASKQEELTSEDEPATETIEG